MTSGSRGAVFQNLRVANLECEFLRVDSLLRIAGRQLGTADLVNTAGFITKKDLLQSDYAETNATSITFIKNKPVLKAVALSGDYNDLVNRPATFSGDYNDLRNRPLLSGGSGGQGGAAFGALTCTGPLKVGPDEGVGTASIPRGVQLYVSEGYDGAGASHSIGDARVNFNSRGDNFVGYCRVYVKNLQSSPSTAKVGFISFVWMKSSNRAASNCSTLIVTRNPNMSVLNVSLVGNYPVVSTDGDCQTSWCIELGG